MWSTLRKAAAGIAEQVGLEIPGLDVAAAAVTDIAGPAAEAAAGVADTVASSDVVASATDAVGAVGAVVPADVAATVSEAAAGPVESVSGIVTETSTGAGALLDGLTGRIAP
jgi:hypothetical protein